MSGISPISGMGISGIGAVPATAQAAMQQASVSPTSGGGFASALTSAVDAVQGTQETANSLAVQAVTGNLDDIADATIAASRAQVTMELASTVRNKAVDAFNQIMNMQA
jgi:flagellar hook-basal body complex protein FliE